MANERSLSPSPDDTSPSRSRSTREVLLDAALDRFSRFGFGGTSIRDLAADAGIRESSVYKHFTSKQAIFDALIERADTRLGTFAAGLGVSFASPAAAAPTYAGITKEALTAVGLATFEQVLRDPEITALRRLMMVEQFRDPEVGRRLTAYFITAPLHFQTELFAILLGTGEFRRGLDPAATALAFFGPVLVLLQLAESGEEDAARAMLTAHIDHFRTTHLAEES